MWYLKFWFAGDQRNGASAIFKYIKTVNKNTMNKISIALFLGVLLLPLASGTCIDEQIIFRISATTNAHAELLDGAENYSEEICWSSSGTHDCSGSNTVLWASDTTNAHVEQDGLVPQNYSTQICFGDLLCSYTEGDCTGNERCVATIFDQTNAHVSSLCSGPGSYPIKVCCSSAAAGPSCVAVPNSGAGPFTSTLNATFTAVDDGTVINFDCFGDGSPDGTDTVNGGMASYNCSYPAVAVVTTYNTSVVWAGAPCETQITVNPVGVPPTGGFVITSFKLDPDYVRLRPAVNPVKAIVIVRNYGVDGDATVPITVLGKGPQGVPGAASIDADKTSDPAIEVSFDVTGWETGNYCVTAEVQRDGVTEDSTACRTLTVFAPRPVPIPELSEFLLPLIAFSVIVIVLFSARKS